jgi:hypothetical protein
MIVMTSSCVGVVEIRYTNHRHINKPYSNTDWWYGFGFTWGDEGRKSVGGKRCASCDSPRPLVGCQGSRSLATLQYIRVSPRPCSCQLRSDHNTPNRAVSIAASGLATRFGKTGSRGRVIPTHSTQRKALLFRQDMFFARNADTGATDR